MENHSGKHQMPSKEEVKKRSDALFKLTTAKLNRTALEEDEQIKRQKAEIPLVKKQSEEFIRKAKEKDQERRIKHSAVPYEEKIKKLNEMIQRELAEEEQQKAATQNPLPLTPKQIYLFKKMGMVIRVSKADLSLVIKSFPEKIYL